MLGGGPRIGDLTFQVSKSASIEFWGPLRWTEGTLRVSWLCYEKIPKFALEYRFNTPFLQFTNLWPKTRWYPSLFNTTWNYYGRQRFCHKSKFELLFNNLRFAGRTRSRWPCPRGHSKYRGRHSPEWQMPWINRSGPPWQVVCNWSGCIVKGCCRKRPQKELLSNVQSNTGVILLGQSFNWSVCVVKCYCRKQVL